VGEMRKIDFEEKELPALEDDSIYSGKSREMLADDY